MVIRATTLGTDIMTVEIGAVLDFVIQDSYIAAYNNNADPGESDPVFGDESIDKYQVYSTIDGTAALLEENDDPLSDTGPDDTPDRSLATLTVAGEGLFTPVSASEYTVSETDFGSSGLTGVIVAYSSLSLTNKYIIPFRVVYSNFLHQRADALIAGAAPNSVMGRLLTCERNQTELILPRLRRALGLLGEHQKVDGFLYDDDGNITECRIRIFRDNEAANGAAMWTDRINDADPATTMGTNELYRYTVTATNLLPRNLRTGYSQVIGINEADEEADNVYGSDGSSSGTNNGSVI